MDRFLNTVNGKQVAARALILSDGRAKACGGDKRSGVGRESAQAEIHASLQTKMVRIDTAGTVAAPFVIR